MASTEEPPFELSERPLEKKLLAELQSIADLMKLERRGVNKDALLKRIRKELNNPRVADDPRLLPLLMHRTTSKALGKDSAGRAQEDNIESSKPIQPATGANKTLLENNVTIDPPAQFKQLSTVSKGSRASGHESGAEVDDSDADGSEEGELPATSMSTPEPNSKVLPVENKLIKSLIHLNLLHPTNTAAPPRSVVVDAFPVTCSTAPDTSPKYTAQLSELIPAALQNDSPIKDSGGMMYRANIRGDAGHHYLGKISTLLTGTASTLKLPAMNEFQLHPVEGGLAGDLFFEPFVQRNEAVATESDVKHAVKSAEPKGANDEEMTEAKAVPDAKPDLVELKDGVDQTVDKKSDALKFTGQGTDIPLEIATDRAKRNPTSNIADPENRKSFSRYLHKIIAGGVVDIPEYGAEWPRSTLAGQMLERKLKQDEISAFLKKWQRTQGGYAVPADSEEYAGVHFEKKVAFDSLGLKSSSTSDNDNYFSAAKLASAPKALEWFESKGSKHASKFERMKAVQFKAYINERFKRSGASSQRKSKKSSARRRPRSSSSASSSDAPSRKHRKTADSSSDDEEEDRHSRKKGKGKARMVSESSDSEDNARVAKKKSKKSEKVITSDTIDDDM